MYYTISKRDVAEEGFAKWGNKYTKMGKNSPNAKRKSYKGGIVFQTLEQAQAYITVYCLKDTHIVLGIEATDRDVEPAKDLPWFYLVNSCLVKRLDEESPQ